MSNREPRPRAATLREKKVTLKTNSHTQSTCLSSAPIAAKLWGRWITDPQDTFSLRQYGQVTLDFQPSGILTYIIHRLPTDKILQHKYTLAGNILIVPEVPEERTPLLFTATGKLVLYYAGHYLRYVREAATLAADELSQR